jgi:hypothetical protein
VHPDDWPPTLEWEDVVWRLYVMLKTQWRHAAHGVTGLDYNPFVALMSESGWPLDSGIEMLQAIEIEMMGLNDE